MGVKTRSLDAPDREKWDKIFNGLVNMLQSQQEQLQDLVKDRKILEDRIRMQHERWEIDLRRYQDHIFMLKRNMKTQEMERLLETVKADFMMGMKQKEASLSKLRVEEAEDLLGDFRLWFDLLVKSSKDISQGNNGSVSKSGSLRKSERQLRKRGHECQNPASEEESSELSALLAENKFAWNQFNVLETELTSKMHRKDAELKEANSKIAALISSMEELKSSNIEKDQIIERLTLEVSQKDADIKMLKSKANCATPVLTPRKAERGGRDGKNAVKKLSSANQANNSMKDTDKRSSKGSKRKADEVIYISETPTLFSSAFKVPKLKSSRLR